MRMRKKKHIAIFSPYCQIILLVMRMMGLHSFIRLFRIIFIPEF